MEYNLLKQLNDSQRAAVEYMDGPSLVIAGAGSGKTRVLTYKIAYLLKSGLEPWDIMALTFTNKAAKEMKSRIGQLVGEDTARRLVMGTFHSVFSHILRIEADSIGFSRNFTIYDESDSRSLLKTIVKELKLDDKKYKPASIHARISMAKNHLVSPEDYATDHNVQQRDFEQKMPDVFKVYSLYCERCRTANAMDFDDLLVYTFKLFNEHEDIRHKYAERYKFVLVDEYQDTNYVQQRIVWQLTKERQLVCVVGDDAQSIYGFRGANIDNILDFQSLYKGAKLFKLEQNYRSTRLIVQAANSLISHNKRQIHKDVFSKNSEGERVKIVPTYSDKEEAHVVCKNITSIKRKDGCQYSDFAILYRTNAQSRCFEEALRKQNIPYRVYGGLSFYQRKEIKDVISYFRLVVNPNDEEAFRRVINYPSRGIGNTTMAKLMTTAVNDSVSMWEIIAHPEQHGTGVNKGTQAKLTAFHDLISSFQDRQATDDAYTLGMDIIKKSGIYADLYSDTSVEAISRQENLEELMNGIKDFVDSRREQGIPGTTISDYLQEVSLMSDLDSDGKDDDNKVMLMTIHSAKGLEFKTVFVVGMEENIFPSPLCTDTVRKLEEERRLFYVAVTRAENHCILTLAKNRMRYGHMERFSPSRFLKDIDPNLVEVEKPSFFNGSYSEGRSSSSSCYQNSSPVATQFRADPIRKVTQLQHKENPVDPFSESFKRKLDMSRANMRRVYPSAFAEKNEAPTRSASSKSIGGLTEGCIIEHQRFGIGKVLRIEGTGENAKATVQFEHSGLKQLLLKFAKFKRIE